MFECSQERFKFRQAVLGLPGCNGHFHARFREHAVALCAYYTTTDSIFAIWASHGC